MTRATDPLGRAVAMARFSVRTNAGRWATRVGIAAGLVVMTLGPLLSLNRGGGWQFDGEIAGMGFFIMALFAIRSGLEEQRELGLDTFLRRNLATRVEHGLGLILGLVLTWIGVCALAFLAVLLISAGDLGTAGWAAGKWSLRLLVLLGFVPLVESVATLRLPLILPTMVYSGLILAAAMILPEDQAIEMFVSTATGDVNALIRLGTQGVVSLALTTAVFLALQVAGPAIRNRLHAMVRTRDA